jgi:hypothetical protein
MDFTMKLAITVFGLGFIGTLGSLALSTANGFPEWGSKLVNGFFSVFWIGVFLLLVEGFFLLWS